MNIIFEEDESSRAPSPLSSYSPSSSRAGSPALSVKARRRHANISDIRIAREIATHDDDDLSPLHDLLLQPSRPAPSPPTSSAGSPDSFRLTFTDVSYKFPHPPTPSPSSLRQRGCASPTESVSSFSSSPLTPVTSDDESLPSRPSLTRRSIQPLVVTKHNPRPSSPSDEISWSPSLLQPYKNSSERLAGAVSPVDSFFLREESVYASDSDEDSDSEYYNRHFSKMLTLCSPTRRASKALPASQELVAARRDSAVFPSDQLDRGFSSRRSSRTRSIMIPKYPPPPPPIRRHSSNSSSSLLVQPSPSPICNKTLSQNVQRPPPRSSIPADCDFEIDIADDDESAFSFSMYAIDLDYGVVESPKSPGSVYSQPSFEVDGEGQELTFDLDYSLMLPLSLPSSPIDLEADIAIGLEKLRNEEDSGFDNVQFILEEEKEASEEQVQEIAQPQPEVVDDIFSPLSSTFSLSPPPSAAASSFSSFSYPSSAPSLDARKHNPYNEERVLKSKWSSSTLGSVREEHERKGTPSKLLHYFSGTPSPLKRTSASSKKVPPTPTSPFSSFMSPRKSSSKYPSSPSPRGHKHSREPSSSDVMVIGYSHMTPQGATGVRRRGSVTTISDAGSDVSFSSTSSSGLRRKPIPVEMFLRSAA